MIFWILTFPICIGDRSMAEPTDKKPQTPLGMTEDQIRAQGLKAIAEGRLLGENRRYCGAWRNSLMLWRADGGGRRPRQVPLFYLRKANRAIRHWGGVTPRDILWRHGIFFVGLHKIFKVIKC